MSLSDKLKQAVRVARGRWRARDPKSYARYERDQGYKRKQADHDLRTQEHSEERARERAQREHGFEERYAVEHERDVARDRARPPDNT